MRAPTQVMIVQPDVPAYRVPLFRTLASRTDLRIAVHASANMPGGPPSSALGEPWIAARPACHSFLGGRLLWQAGTRLPPDLERGDVLVVAGNPRYLSNIPLIIAARRRGVGIIWWGHGWSPTSAVWRARLRRMMMRVADVVLCYADAEARALNGELDADIHVTATNNTLDPQPMLAAQRAWPAEKLSEFRARAGIENKRIILFCGRLRRNPSCGLELALQAMAQARKQSQNYLLAVIGIGERETELRALAVELGIADSVRWLGEIYGEDELAPWFLSASCFVYPGSIGLSLLHAFCYGLPVVTHDQLRLHNPEIHALRDGENGRLYRKGDAASLWRVITELCTDEQARLAMAEAARRTALVEWSFDSMVQRFVGAIEAASQRKQPLFTRSAVTR